MTIEDHSGLETEDPERQGVIDGIVIRVLSDATAVHRENDSGLKVPPEEPSEQERADLREQAAKHAITPEEVKAAANRRIDAVTMSTGLRNERYERVASAIGWFFNPPDESQTTGSSS